MVYTVCNYDPPGNLGGRYLANVQLPKEELIEVQDEEGPVIKSVIFRMGLAECYCLNAIGTVLLGTSRRPLHAILHLVATPRSGI